MHEACLLVDLTGLMDESSLRSSMLKGSELIAKVEELGDAKRSELVRICGYVSASKDGRERVNSTAFYQALLEALGLCIGWGEGNGKGKLCRKLSYVAKVHFNGNLLVGKAYTARLELNPGDEFEIKLSRKQIILTPRGAVDEDK